MQSNSTGGEPSTEFVRAVTKVRFGTSLTVEKTSRQLAALSLRKSHSVRFDLSQCRHFDVVALLQVVAITAQRSSASLVTRFVLPVDQGAQNYLRRRGFAAAIENVADAPFRLLVDEAWFNGDALSSPGAPLGDAQSAILAYLDDHRFFAFEHYDVLRSDDMIPVIEQEHRRWRDPLVVELLQSRLSSQHAVDVARVVVREMLTNLLASAPSGDVVCVADITTAPDGVGQPCLTIAAWHRTVDKSLRRPPIFEQLMAVIDQPDQREVFTITFGKPIRSRRRALADLTRIPKHRQLLNPPNHVETNTGNANLRLRGLEALYKYVIDEFHGRIDLWSDQNYVQVLKQSENSYLLNVQQYDRLKDPGSLIAVRLPLSHA
jgi:hypothetical protein